MPNLAKAFRAEVRTAAAGELRRALQPLHRIERSLRTLVTLTRRRGTPNGPLGRPSAPRPAGRRPAAGSPEVTIRPAEVRAMRRRFGMNRPQFGRLAGVSTWTVFMWEHGKVVPSPASVLQLRRLTKLTPEAATKASNRPRKRRGPGRPRRA